VAKTKAMTMAFRKGHSRAAMITTAAMKLVSKKGR
jgi:hypothetical protein